MIELPSTKRDVIRKNPSFMIIFSKPKIGKTTALSMLENNLIIEMEPRGADYVSGLIVEANSAKDLLEIAKSIKEAGCPYKYITLDTATAMEDNIIGSIAIRMYQNTPMGANYKGDDLRKLPNGSGYLYLREAFNYIIDLFTPLCECLILLAHCNEKQIDKEGKEMYELEMDLTGKTKRITQSRADAIGLLYRKDNKTIINFNGGGDAIIEARSEHLSNKEFTLIEKIDNKFISHWDQIFIK